jgi:hypothetical protein
MSFFTRLPEPLYSRDAFAAFNPSRAFDLGTARALAWMSQLAYETDNRDKIERILGLWNLRLVTLLKAEVRRLVRVANTHGLVASRDDVQIIAFAGTDPVDLANWISDFDARIDQKGAAQGYETAADSIWPSVMQAISAAPAKAIFVTGHSLGGALAVLTAQAIKATPEAKLAAVYTFGMPRVGDAQFAEPYDTSIGDVTYRLVHGEDMVPTVAPEGIGFRHVGRYLHCERQAKFDASGLLTVGASNAPRFVEGISKELASVLHRPLLVARSAISRIALAAKALTGNAPPGIRHDIGGVAIELLPLRLRDHMPDRYIGSLSP